MRAAGAFCERRLTREPKGTYNPTAKSLCNARIQAHHSWSHCARRALTVRTSATMTLNVKLHLHTSPLNLVTQYGDGYLT